MDIDVDGFQCRPSDDKVAKWTRRIQRMLSDQRLTPGEASQLAGQLNWASSAIFRRIGRAMTRPIFDQCTRRDGTFEAGGELDRALRWWLDVLTVGLAERQEWDVPRGNPVHLFCDASGVPPLPSSQLVFVASLRAVQAKIRILVPYLSLTDRHTSPILKLLPRC